ncbi:hypothetical protein GW17_00006773, partial [Ensete ventricosum]
RHRWTGRYEAHLWDNSCRREGQTRKGRQGKLLLASRWLRQRRQGSSGLRFGCSQVLGYFHDHQLPCRFFLSLFQRCGNKSIAISQTKLNESFQTSNYEKELEEMKHMTRQEYNSISSGITQVLECRKSSGFSRGASIYRGPTVSLKHKFAGIAVGTQEEAAEAYDIAAIKFRGLNAVTNFDMSRYDVKAILESSTLPIGGAAKRLKEISEHTEASVDGRMADDGSITSHLTDTISSYASHHHGWPTIGFQQSQPLAVQYPYGHQPRGWYCKQEQDAVIAAAHGLQDLQQLNLGNSTHNFFQPSVIHNLVNLESSSMDHSTGSNAVIYSGNVGGSGGSYQLDGSGGFVMPVGTTMVGDQNNQGGSSSYAESEGKQMGYENMLAAGDPYGGRSIYYLSQPSGVGTGVVKENGYEQMNGCNTWVAAPVQASANGGNNVTVCHGAPLFTVWNDA